MANDPTPSTEAAVRARLRTLRQQRGLSQEAVAQAANMATSTLSRLESGERRLALDHLGPLARALGVTMADLLAPAVARDPRVQAAPHTVQGMTIWPLSDPESTGGQRVVRIQLPADRTVPDQRTHEGHEWFYVLSGNVRLVLGDDDLVLRPGEAAEFSTWTPHWLGAVDGPAEVLAIFGPQGERVHLRATG